MKNKERILDVSCSTQSYIPYERETDTLIIGANIMTEKCPGKLVGLYHPEGNVAIEQWEADNPDWRKKYLGE